MPLSILTQCFNFFSFLNFNSCFYLVFLLNPPQHVRWFKILVSLANQSIINKIHKAMITNLYFYTRSIIPKHPVSTRDGTGTWIKPGSTGIYVEFLDLTSFVHSLAHSFIHTKLQKEQTMVLMLHNIITNIAKYQSQATSLSFDKQY